MTTNYSDIAKTVDIKNTSADTSVNLISSESDKEKTYANLAVDDKKISVSFVKNETESKVSKLNAAKSARAERSKGLPIRSSITGTSSGGTNEVSTSANALSKSSGVTNLSHVRSGAFSVARYLGRSEELEGIDKPVDIYYQYKGLKRLNEVRRERTIAKTSTSEKTNVAAEMKATRTGASVNSEKAAYEVSKKTVQNTSRVASTSTSGAVGTAGASTVAAGGTTVGAAAGGAVASGGGGILAGIASAIGFPLAIIGGLLALIILIPLFLGAIASDESNKGYGNLEGVCLEICQFLREKGVDDVQIAAICGNIWGESGYRPSAIEYDSNGNVLYGHGLCQWSFGRWTQLQNYASVKHKDWTDTQLQLEFLWAELTGEGDAAPYSNRQINWEAFCSIKDVDVATSNFCKQFERPANPVQPKRQAEARRVYEQLQIGGNEDYGNASEKGKAIANACHTTPTAGAGWCAKWVSDVYQKAGLTRPGGNACDMYWQYCKSSNRSELEVGMIIAVPTHPWNQAGVLYGHVGIYVGNGMVMHNAGSIETTPIDQWIATYGRTATVRWGWA